MLAENSRRTQTPTSTPADKLKRKRSTISLNSKDTVAHKISRSPSTEGISSLTSQDLLDISTRDSSPSFGAAAEAISLQAEN